MGRELFDRLYSPAPQTDNSILRYNELKNDINWQSDRLFNALVRVTPKASLEVVVIPLVEHCNLNCWGCDHCAPLAEKNFLDIAEFEKDINRIAELAKICGGVLQE